MSLGFVDRLAIGLRISRRDMVEKDILLHKVLIDLSNDRAFATTLA